MLYCTFPHSAWLTLGWRGTTARKKGSGRSKDSHRRRKCCLNRELGIAVPLRVLAGQRTCVRNGPAVWQEQCDPTRTKQSEFQQFRWGGSAGSADRNQRDAPINSQLPPATASILLKRLEPRLESFQGTSPHDSCMVWAHSLTTGNPTWGRVCQSWAPSQRRLGNCTQTVADPTFSMAQPEREALFRNDSG